MKAKILDGFLMIKEVESIGSISVIKVSMKSERDDWAAEYLNAPAAIEYNGRIYGRSAWNSDKGEIYYRTDAKLVKVCS
jgi:hypothetical protein